MIPNILHLHHGGNAVGGIETYLSNTISLYKKCNPAIAFICKGEYPERVYNSGFRNIIFLNGGKLRNIFRTAVAIYNCLKVIKSCKIDVLIVHGNYSWFYGGIVTKLIKIKSVLYVHAHLNKNCLNLIDRVALSFKPDVYIANSKYTAGTIRDLFPDAKIYVNYPCTISSDTFNHFDHTAGKQKITIEFNINEDSIIITHVGRIQAWKGQDVAIRAFGNILSYYPNSYLFIVGAPTFKTDEKYFQYLKNLASEMSITDRVIFTGYRDDVLSFYSASDIIIHSSRGIEPFGLTVTEGMFLKKPVIASNAGGPVEMIDHGINGYLVAPNNPKELAYYINKILGDPDLKCRLGENAYLKIKKTLSIEGNIEIMENIIYNIIQST